MRTQNQLPDSSPVEPDRPAVGEDVSLQTHPVGPTAATSPHQLSLSITDHEDPPGAEATSLIHLPAHPQSHHHPAPNGVNTGNITGEEGNHDNDIADVEEGGAPLYDTNMEEMDEPPPLSPLQDTSPAPNITNASAHDSAPQVSIPAAVDPSTSPVITDTTTTFQQPVDNPGHGFDGFEPYLLPLANANPGILVPGNYNSLDFLRLWRWAKTRDRLKHIKGMPCNEMSLINIKRPRVIYEDLKGDAYDLQGIDWQHLGVARTSARKCRQAIFRNFTHNPGSDIWDRSLPDRLLTRHENYFRFRSMDLRNDVRLLHFQLRNIMGCASRTAVYYPSVSGVVRKLDPTTGHVGTAMKFKNTQDGAVSTLAAEAGMLVTGSFYGTYRYRRIETNDEPSCHDGVLTDHISGITNHVQVDTSRRSSIPLAAFASNDFGFRVIDMARNEAILDRKYDYLLNCTALSPDKRLRVMVGDLQNVLIAEAETGKILQSLKGHRDFGFACDWAPDGWTVATANQDRSIRIWDARKWKNSKDESISVSVMRTEMAGVRSLRFSPLGSGKRLLLAAEEADVINIIDAQTFNSKQTIDVFGELAGVSFTSAGQEVVALSSDPIRGGVLCLERCDHGVEDNFDYRPKQYPHNPFRTSGYDWLPTPQQVVDQPESQVTLTQKRRQAAMAEDWFF